VEILKQLYLEAFLIPDEPTSVLTLAEADEVLGLIRDKVKAGQLSVLLITHKFREIFGFCDDITVLRRGKFAAWSCPGSVDRSTGAMMMGGEREVKVVPKAARSRGAPLLELNQVCAIATVECQRSTASAFQSRR